MVASQEAHMQDMKAPMVAPPPPPKVDFASKHGGFVLAVEGIW